MATVKRLIFALVFLVSGTGGSRESNASLTIDLRAVSTTSGTVLDHKHVLFTGGSGDTVIMDVVAVVTGGTNANPNDDIILFLHGSFLSGVGGLTGDLNARLDPDYMGDGPLSSPGKRQDLDADGDVDVGSNNASSGADFFRSFRGQFAPFVPEATVGTLTWTPTSEIGSTLLNFRPRDVPDGARWTNDGFAITPETGDFANGPPVVIATPEPGHVIPLLAIVAAALKRLGRASISSHGVQVDREQYHEPNSNGLRRCLFDSRDGCESVRPRHQGPKLQCVDLWNGYFGEPTRFDGRGGRRPFCGVD